MFGCQIFVSNCIFGGTKGYLSGNRISIWNFPPVYTVSIGPSMTAFQCVLLPAPTLQTLKSFLLGDRLLKIEELLLNALFWIHC